MSNGHSGVGGNSALSNDTAGSSYQASGSTSGGGVSSVEMSSRTGGTGGAGGNDSNISKPMHSSSNGTTSNAPPAAAATAATAIPMKSSTGGTGSSGSSSSGGGAKGASRTGFFIKYDLKEQLGVGSTATCHKCVRKNDQMEFACKVIDKQQIEDKFTGLLDQFYVEIKALQTLRHPNIIHLVDVYETSAKIYMVMEVMNGGELFDYVVEKGTLSEEEASTFVRSITSAVCHMHSMNIIHRDLKPENLLLTSKHKNAEVKLIDFGLAKIIAAGNSPAAATSFLGTKGYLAPEMLQRNSYDKAIDMWALGIIVFVLLCGCLPFDDDSSKIPSESAARKKFTLRFPRWSTNLSASAKDLLHNLLDVNPKTRFTAEQALAHPWVSGKTVVPNNYLQSPSVLGERRKDQRAPLTPRMQEMHDKLQQANSNTSGTAGFASNWAEPRARKNSV